MKQIIEIVDVLGRDAFPADCQYRDTRGENPEPFRAGRF